MVDGDEEIHTGESQHRDRKLLERRWLSHEIGRKGNRPARPEIVSAGLEKARPPQGHEWPRAMHFLHNGKVLKNHDL